MNKRLLLSCFLVHSWILLLSQSYDDYLGNGHQLGISVETSHSQDTSYTGEATVDGFWVSGIPSMEDASRFLAQSTLGADASLIEYTAQIGYESWLEEQFDIPPTYTGDRLEQVLNTWASIADTVPSNEVYSLFFRAAWWDAILTSEDLLRQRIALALSEIFVISDQTDQLFLTGRGMADYYDMLLKHALGNYRDLLMDITLHPCMGLYLSHLNNPRANPQRNTHPDENYAREIMQLFSIGLYELNPDGSRKTDEEGNFIATYTNEDIAEFAKVFTGLYGAAFRDYVVDMAIEMGTEVPEDVFFGANFAFIDPTQPMIMFQQAHEPGRKFLLRDQTIPALQPGIEDIEEAIDNLFYHPNVGPFIGRLLIQRLVKSNPSPGYISRVSATFNDNGAGVRGDMTAVIRTILLDPEARDCQASMDPIAGMLREPIVRYTHLMRAFRASSIFDTYISTGQRFRNATGQFPMNSPSVFNFFLPDYQPNGPIAQQDLFAPEFQIHNTTSSIGYVNEVYNWLIEGNILPIYFNNPDPTELGFGTGLLNLEKEIALAKEPDALLEHLNIIMAHGQLSERSLAIIRNSLLQIPVDNAEARVRLALYLIMISPDYAIIK